MGDVVESFDVERGARTTATVLQLTIGRTDALLAFGHLRVTGRHPMWADGTWQLAEDVAPGAMLLGLDGAPLAADPTAVDTPSAVYDLSVSAPHTYFAGGVLVHNKAVYQPLASGPWRELFYRRAAKN